MRAAKDKDYADLSYGRLQNELEDHFHQYEEENKELKDRVRKLDIVYNGLQSTQGTKKKIGGPARGKQGSVGRPSTGAKHKPTSVTYSGSFNPHATSMTPQQLHVVSEFQSQMQKNAKQILQLKTEREKLYHSTHGSHNS